MNITVSSIEALSAVVDIMTSRVEEGYSVFLLSGDLGAGKTTLVQSVCANWGVPGPVTSPTFSLVHAYESPVFGVIYHMDLYRLEKQEDLVQIGFEEYLESGHLCLVEWPEIALGYFTMPHIAIKIQMDINNIRTFIITTYDAVDA